MGPQRRLPFHDIRSAIAWKTLFPENCENVSREIDEVGTRLTWMASTAPGMSSSRRGEIEIVDVGIIRFPLHIREGFGNQW
jgi:hypothetical protein